MVVPNRSYAMIPFVCFKSVCDDVLSNEVEGETMINESPASPAGTTLPHSFVPLQDGPWLSRRIWTPAVRRGVLGLLALSMLLLLCIPAYTTSFVLGLLRYGGTFFAFSMLLSLGIGLVGETLTARTRQYCPECLRYTTRGARVCPFCHFRPGHPH